MTTVACADIGVNEPHGPEDFNADDATLAVTGKRGRVHRLFIVYVHRSVHQEIPSDVGRVGLEPTTNGL